MMLKKILILLLVQLSLISKLSSSENITIVGKIANKIITSYDVEKEASYLKILNSNLSNLDDKKIFEIGKNSLSNELIKKKELEKFFDLNKKNPFIKKIFKNFYKDLNIKSENEFKKYLSNKKTYSVNEIKEKIKIEIMWNQLIYKLYNRQVSVDENELLKRINNEKNIIKEYLLYEIFFKIENSENLNEKKEKILSSISDIGFNNTANLYSISESSSYGGKIGWVKETNLSEIIKTELEKINVGQHSKVMQIGNNFLILKIEDKRSSNKTIDKKARLEELKKFEVNKQLNLYSNIYFNKIKINYSLNEK
ncbi:peptidylprolyl isomerase [Candidatus Pelagibacter sp.]|nr:peptidylprolyl isomerase [Candidatus Pelagibacter sp.]